MRVKTPGVMQYVEDPTSFRKSLVIPLPGDRALRVGFGFEGWFRFGPRKYEVIIPQRVWDHMVEIMGQDEAEEMRREIEATVAADPMRGDRCN